MLFNWGTCLSSYLQDSFNITIDPVKSKCFLRFIKGILAFLLQGPATLLATFLGAP